MSTAWIELALRVGDWLLGWLWAWHLDAALVALIVLTAAIVHTVRWIVARPDVVRTAKADERQLRRLLHAARRAGDRDALTRFRRTRLRVAGVRLREELRAGAVAFLPVALLVTWGTARFEWVPPAEGAPLLLRVQLPEIWEGEVLHVVPHPEYRAANGWLATARRTSAEGPAEPRAIAHWQLRPAPGAGPRDFQIRFRDRTLIHRWRGADGRLLNPVQRHGDQILSSIELAAYRPCPLLPDTTRYGIAPWLLVYLPLVLLVSALLRWASGLIYRVSSMDLPKLGSSPQHIG